MLVDPMHIGPAAARQSIMLGLRPQVLTIFSIELVMAVAKSWRRCGGIASQKRDSGILGSLRPGNDYWLDAVAEKSLGGTRAHSAAKNYSTIMQ